jgi:hypothetical protein
MASNGVLERSNPSTYEAEYASGSARSAALLESHFDYPPRKENHHAAV